MRESKFDLDINRLSTAKRILGLALLTQIAVCPRLFQTVRAFPCLPVVPSLPDLPQWLCLAILAVTVITAFWMAAVPKRSPLTWVLFASLGLLVLFDINRLQPWLYQILLLLAALSGFDWNRSENSPWELGGAVLIATYVWSGIQKLNPSFAHQGFPSLIHPLRLDPLASVWFLVPITEIGVGLLLISPKTRTLGVVGVVFTHLVALVLIGPLGLKINPAVWPWNVWAPILVAAFFLKNRQPFRIPKLPLTAPVALLALVMPAFSFAGLWDEYLSFSLYSGRSSSGYLFLTPSGLSSLPPTYRSQIHVGPKSSGLDLFAWSNRVLNVPIYPEKRVYVELAKKLVLMGMPRSEIQLVISEKPSLFAPKATFSVVPF